MQDISRLSSESERAKNTIHSVLAYTKDIYYHDFDYDYDYDDDYYYCYCTAERAEQG